MSDNQAFITGLEAALGVATGPDGMSQLQLATEISSLD
jgi:hypothetical protein